MPIEVYPVEGSHHPIGHLNKDYIRTEEEVAEDIKKRYEEVAKKGGQMIAGYTVAKTGTHDVVPILYLVAEVPDPDEPFVK